MPSTSPRASAPSAGAPGPWGSGSASSSSPTRAEGRHMVINYDEKSDSMSPCSAGMQLINGRAVTVHDVATADLGAAIRDLLGATTIDPATPTGKLERVVPKAHPEYPWWLCNALL